MGWIMLPKPGTKLGPCVPECKHTDCAATRLDAAARCTICNQPIGYDTPFYGLRPDTQHFVCLQSQEHERRALAQEKPF